MPSKGSAKTAEAQERRREQNRIAQRNHRNKVRERQIAETLSASPASDMFLDMTKDSNQWPSGPGSTHSSISYPSGQIPLPMNLYGMGPGLNVDFNSASCSCSGWPGSYELQTSQMAAETFSQPQIDQMFSSKPPDFAVETFNWPPPIPHSEGNENTVAASDIPTDSVPQLLRTNSIAYSPTHVPSNMVGVETTQSRTPPPPPASEREGSQTPYRPSVACDTPRIQAGNMTQRFTKLLDYMQDCGFNNFDEAAALYYTHNFEKQSAPDAAQRTSRGRRLRKVLADIEECSTNWSTWEVRGYQDKIVEAAETTFGTEMTNIAGINVPAPLSWLSQSNNPQQALNSFQELYEHKVPNLWNTLSSLAGIQGASGELAATAALSILHWTATNPAATSEDFLLAMASRPSLMQTKMDDTDSGYGSASSSTSSRCASRFSSSESIQSAHV